MLREVKEQTNLTGDHRRLYAAPLTWDAIRMLTVKMSTVIMSTVEIFFLSSHKNLHFDKAVDILTYKCRHFNTKVGIMITNFF